MRELFASLSESAPREQSADLIRWARNPRLLDAHEQVTYGDMMRWSGDPMRRDADKRNALALFDEGCSVRVRHGRLAFEALWAVSSPVFRNAACWRCDAQALWRLSARAGDPGDGA